MGRALDARGEAVGAVLNLRHNGDLPPVPGEAEVLFHREPAVVLDRAGRALVAWTQELVRIRIDYFFEDRVVLQRDVFAQFFDDSGRPLGEAFRVHTQPLDFRVGRSSLCSRGWQHGPRLDRLGERRSTTGCCPGGFRAALSNLQSKAGRRRVHGRIGRRPPGRGREPRGSALIGWEATSDTGKLAVFGRSLNAATKVLGSGQADQCVAAAVARPVRVGAQWRRLSRGLGLVAECGPNAPLHPRTQGRWDPERPPGTADRRHGTSGVGTGTRGAWRRGLGGLVPVGNVAGRGRARRQAHQGRQCHRHCVSGSSDGLSHSAR